MNETVQLGLLMLAALGTPLLLAAGARLLQPTVELEIVDGAPVPDPVPDAVPDIRSTPDLSGEADRRQWRETSAREVVFTCGSCCYFDHTEGRGRAGVCRLRPPFVPVQAKLDWCGDYTMVRGMSSRSIQRRSQQRAVARDRKESAFAGKADAPSDEPGRAARPLRVWRRMMRSDG